MRDETKTKKSFYLPEWLVRRLRKHCAELPGKKVSESYVAEKALDSYLNKKKGD